MFCPKTYLLFIVLRIVVVASAAPVSRSPFAEPAAWWMKRYYTNLDTLDSTWLAEVLNCAHWSASSTQPAPSVLGPESY